MPKLTPDVSLRNEWCEYFHFHFLDIFDEGSTFRVQYRPSKWEAFKSYFGFGPTQSDMKTAVRKVVYRKFFQNNSNRMGAVANILYEEK